MVKTLFPANRRRYSSLTIFGPILDGFTTWLREHRYSDSYTRQRIWLLTYIESALIRRGVHHVGEIEQAERGVRRGHPHECGLDGARLRKQLQNGRGNDTECPFGTNEQILEIIAGIILSQLAQAVPNLTVAQHHFETQHEIAGRSVGKHRNATGVGIWAGSKAGPGTDWQ